MQDIRNLETAIAESAALRVNATQLQVETDIKVQSVQNITTTVCFHDYYSCCGRFIFVAVIIVVVLYMTVL